MFPEKDLKINETLQSLRVKNNTTKKKKKVFEKDTGKCKKLY